jgi:hypothetical protein
MVLMRPAEIFTPTHPLAHKVSHKGVCGSIVGLVESVKLSTNNHHYNLVRRFSVNRLQSVKGGKSGEVWSKNCAGTPFQEKDSRYRATNKKPWPVDTNSGLKVKGDNLP